MVFFHSYFICFFFLFLLNLYNVCFFEYLNFDGSEFHTHKYRYTFICSYVEQCFEKKVYYVYQTYFYIHMMSVCISVCLKVNLKLMLYDEYERCYKWKFMYLFYDLKTNKHTCTSIHDRLPPQKDTKRMMNISDTNVERSTNTPYQNWIGSFVLLRGWKFTCFNTIDVYLLCKWMKIIERKWIRNWI